MRVTLLEWDMSLEPGESRSIHCLLAHGLDIIQTIHSRYKISSKWHPSIYKCTCNDYHIVWGFICRGQKWYNIGNENILYLAKHLVLVHKYTCSEDAEAMDMNLLRPEQGNTATMWFCWLWTDGIKLANKKERKQESPIIFLSSLSKRMIYRMEKVKNIIVYG